MVLKLHPVTSAIWRVDRPAREHGAVEKVESFNLSSLVGHVIAVGMGKFPMFLSD